MQLSRRARAPGAPKRGFIQTGAEIVKRETPLGLYKGLGAVMTGIVPKMAIRFTSFEAYKQLLADKQTGIVSGQATFMGTAPHALPDNLRAEANFLRPQPVSPPA
jgi:solute carrier family 25 (mitochondrial citrate transporter), member 1